MNEGNSMLENLESVFIYSGDKNKKPSAKIYQKHKKTYDINPRINIDIITQTLLCALNMRENKTCHHSIRVANYTLALCRRFNISDHELLSYKNAALLHDVGKIGVSDSILLKPDKLNSLEWNEMKKHSQYGFQMLTNLYYPNEVTKIVYSHHEWYNGSGYPNGIKGDRIPFGARIFTVADALDAMTSERIYRTTISFEEAIQIIKDGSGKQFDPAIVEVLLNIPAEELRKIRNHVDTKTLGYLK